MSTTIARWVVFIEARARVVAMLSLSVSAAAGVYAAAFLGVNANIASLFPQDMPHRVLELEHARHFPCTGDDLLVVVDGNAFETVRDAAINVAGRLATRPDLFANVYLPRDAFFDEHALLYMGTDELAEFADRLARVQPYVAGLAKDGTLGGLVHWIERGVAAARDGDIGGAELAPMLDQFARSLDAAIDGRVHSVSWAEVVAGKALAADDLRRFVVVRPKLDNSKLVAGAAAMEGIHAAIAELGFDRGGDVRVRVTGDLALSYEEMSLVEEQSRVAGLASFLVVTALLFVALGSVRLVVATIATLLAGLSWTAAFATVAIGTLNVISVAFAVLFIGLSVDFAIHFCLRYVEVRDQGDGHERALERTARGVGTSILLCALTTAIGFYAFIPTDFVGVAELGVISGTGVFFGAAASFTVLPALLGFGSRRPVSQRVPPSAGAGSWIGWLPHRFPHAVVIGGVVLGLGGAALLPRAAFDHHPLGVRDPQAESVQAFAELLAGDSMSPWDLSVLAPDIEAADRLADSLVALPEVDSASTVGDYVPSDQLEKLEILQDVALFLEPAGTGEAGGPAPSTGEQLAALRSLDEALASLLDRPGGAAVELLPIAADARASLDRFLRESRSPEAADKAVAAAEDALLGSLPERLDLLRRAVNVGPITVDSLPSSLLERMISEDGLARIVVRPAEDLNDSAALERFVAAVRGVAPEVSGPAISVYEHSRAVIHAFQQALAAAIVVIALLLFVIWGTVGEAALVMAPLALAAVLTAATALVVGIPFNYADIIVLPLLLGIGVDSGIHLVERARSEERGARSLLATSTAQAVFFSSLTTVASFGTLAFASHRGLASMGRLLAVGVAFALVCNLIFLPALIELRRRRRER